jgi:hypothetical protein
VVLLPHRLQENFLANGMDLKKLELHLYVVDSFLIRFLRLQDVVHLDVLQNLDEQNLDAHLPYLDVVHLRDVVVDVERHHQLRMDYFLDVVGVELRHLSRMDCYQDVALQVLQVQLAQLVQEPQLLPSLLLLQLSPHHVMP